ncbi:MAG: hypothetical protein K6L81_16160 [Agarilytica sp.]
MKIRSLFFAGVWIISSAALGAAQTVTGKISALTSYSTYGNGDVLFEMETLPSGCNGGFWLKKDDPGFSGNLSIVLSAFHAGTTVKAAGYDTELWPAAPTVNYCRVTWLTLSK